MLAVVTGLVTMLAGWTHVRAAAVFSEEAVKAAFLHRLAAYVEWPTAGTSVAADAPFVIGVVSGEGVVEHLERLVPGRTIRGRVAEVRKVTSIESLAGVDILYVGPGNPALSRALITAAQNRPILIVTDEEGGLAKGGIINFVPVRQNVRMEVSLPAAERNGLRIQSGLLAVAVRVEGRPRADTTQQIDMYAHAVASPGP